MILWIRNYVIDNRQLQNNCLYNVGIVLRHLLGNSSLIQHRIKSKACSYTLDIFLYEHLWKCSFSLQKLMCKVHNIPFRKKNLLYIGQDFFAYIIKRDWMLLNIKKKPVKILQLYIFHYCQGGFISIKYKH